jgi:hypothetical protein
MLEGRQLLASGYGKNLSRKLLYICNSLMLFYSLESTIMLVIDSKLGVDSSGNQRRPS